MEDPSSLHSAFLPQRIEKRKTLLQPKQIPNSPMTTLECWYSRNPDGVSLPRSTEIKESDIASRQYE